MSVREFSEATEASLADPPSSVTADDARLDRAAPRPAATAAGWERRYRRWVVSVDLVAAAVGALAAFGIRFGQADDPPWSYAVTIGVLPLAWVCCMRLFSGYDPRFLYLGADEYRRVALVGLTLTSVVAVGSYASKAEIARGYVVTVLILVLALDVVGRRVLRWRLHRRWRSGLQRQRVVLVGYERAVATMCRRLATDTRHGMNVVAACLPPHRPARSTIEDVQLPVGGTFADVAETVRAYDADTVAILACPELDGPVLRRLGWELESRRTRLLVGAGLVDVAAPRTTVRPVSGLPLLHVEHAELAGVSRAVKEVFDRAVAAVGVLLLSPVFLAVALAIRIGSEGPAFFRQVRVGRDGRAFTMLKFRTMRIDAEARLGELITANESDGVLFKVRRDPRITAAGRWLRRLSLDELPQLLNVVRGDMSLVGPRPPLPREVEQYETDVRRRLAVKPGLTGLWQVSGRSDLAWEESVRLDLSYVENWTFWMDLTILWRTLSAVVRGTGAY